MRRAAAISWFVVLVLLTTGGVEPAGATSQNAGSTRVAEAATADWRQVSAGAVHTCGIRTSGRLYCWGDDDFSQLGNGGANTDAGLPVEVAGGHTDWATVSAGGFFTCARRTTGRLYCWGADTFGAVGNGAPNANVSTPVEVAGNRTDWRQVSAGNDHVCAKRSTGRLYCWGNDGTGAVGNGPGTQSQSSPVQVAGGATTWSQVSAGFLFTCARRTNGRLYCWGDDGNGEQGNGPGIQFQFAPAEVVGGFTDWTSVAAGVDHACGRRGTGRLFCWGLNNHGQVGIGSVNQSRPSPVQVAGGHTDWRQVSLGDRSTCARRANGRLYCWGFDNTGQIGNGLPNTDVSSPVEVAGNATDWGAADGGFLHMCAKRTTGFLYCWGYDSDGQLGDGGSDSPVSSPVLVGG